MVNAYFLDTRALVKRYIIVELNLHMTDLASKLCDRQSL